MYILAMFLLVFGQPNVTLDCLVDDVMLNKVVKVQWQVTLKNESETTSLSTADEINDRIANCEANIMCSHGYIERVSAITQTIITSHLCSLTLM